MEINKTKELDSIFAGQSIPEYDTVDMAMDIPQEQAMQTIKLASNAGIPLAEAAEKPDTIISNNITANDLSSMKDTHPATANFLNNPIYLSSAREKRDTSSLMSLEGLYKHGQALENGIKGIGLAIAGTGKAISDVATQGYNKPGITTKDKFFSYDNITRAVASMSNPLAVKALEKASSDVLGSEYLKLKEVKSDSQLEQFVLDIEQNVPQLAAQIGVNYLSGGTASMLFMGSQIAGQQYADLKNEGVSTENAFKASTTNAAIQMPLEKIGLGSILKVSGAGVKQKLATIARATLTEGLTEFLQQYPEDVTSLLAKNADKSIEEKTDLLQKDFGQMTKNAAYAGLLGGFLGGGGAAIHVALQKNVLDARGEQLDNKIEEIKKSPLLEKSPETISAFQSSLEGDKKYYIDADALSQYAQSTSNKNVLDTLEVKQETLSSAVETGQMVPVNAGAYEVLSAQHPEMHETLKKDIAFNEDGLTKNRSELLNSKEIMKQQQEMQSIEENLQIEKDNIYDNLRRVGLNDIESTSTLSLLVSNAYQMQPENPALWLKEKAPTFLKSKSIDGITSYNQITDYYAVEGGKELLTKLKEANIYALFGKEYFSKAVEVYKPFQKGIANKNNFMLDTITTFEKKNSRPKRKPDYVSRNRRTGKISSEYWYTKDGVVRGSDHWGTGIASCDWALSTLYGYGSTPSKSNKLYGYSKWSDFVQKTKLANDTLSNFENTTKEIAEPFVFKQQEKGQEDKTKNNEQNNLVALHNLTTDNFLHTLKLGGLAVPSIAITDINKPMENFGEITLIGDTTLINPKNSKNKVYNADVYSPRYPQIIADIDSNKIDKYSEEITALSKYKGIYQDYGRKPSIDDTEEKAKSGTRELRYDKAVRLLYASRNGLSLDAKYKDLDQFINEHEAGFSEFLDEFLTDVSKGEKIFKGFTNSGNRKYIPHTLDNVVKELSQTVRDGEGFNYGLGSLRANVAKRYKTLKEIQKDRNKVIGKEAFEKARDIMNKEFDEIISDAVNHYSHNVDFSTSDNFIEVLKEGIKRNNIASELKEYGFEGVDVNRINAFLSAVKDMPTEYFEAKIQRAVHLNEFAGAVIPQNTSQKIKDALANNGIPFKEYDGENRQEVIKNFVSEINEQKGNVLFQDQKQLTNEEKQQTKGMVAWDDKGKAYISLFQKGDMSTIIHEMLGHYFSQNIIEEGIKEDAPDWLKQDRQKLLEYAGVTKEFKDLTKAEFTEAHEKWAEAAETYMMEGKAPTKELASIFKRFKKWLTAIYSVISRNDNSIPITDEVRGVFDRMLSSEKDVQMVENFEGYLKKLPADLTENLTEAQKKTLANQIEKAHDKAVENIAKASLENFTAERKEEIANYKESIRPEAETEIMKDKLYIASDMLLEDNNATNIKAVGTKYMELTTNDTNIEVELTDKQALWLDGFDMLAESLDFSSGNELAQKILNSPTKEQAIRSYIDEKVKEKYPNYADEKKERYERAKQALYNDESALVLAEENKIIENKINSLNENIKKGEDNKQAAKALKENMMLAAQDFLSDKIISDAINFKKFMTAERMASEKATVALSKKDYDGALQYKRLQLYNHSLVQEALKIKQELKANITYLKKQRKSKKETWIKEEHFVQAADILDRFGVIRKDYNPAIKTESLKEWATRNNELYDNVAIEPWLYSERKAFVPDKMLTMSELTDVINALKNVKKVAQDENKFSKFMGGRMLDEVVSKLTEQLAPMKDVYIPEVGKDAPVSAIARYMAELETRDTFLGRLDSWKHGLFTTLFGDSIEDCNNRETKLKAEYQEAEQKNKDMAFPTKQAQKNSIQKVYYEELKTSVDKLTLIELALNTGSESSKKAVFGTPPVGFENSPLWVQGDALQTEDNVMRFLGKTLTRNEWKYVQGAWNNMSFLWPLAQETQKLATGFTNKGVDASPFEITLADGSTMVMNGGYHPLARDTRTGSKHAQTDTEGIPLSQQNNNIKTMHTFTGYQIARTGASYPVKLSPNSRYINVDKSLHDVTHRLVINDIRKLLNNTEFNTMLRQKLGRERYEAFHNYLEVSADPWTEEANQGHDSLDMTADWLRRKSTNVMIMWNLKVVIQNLGNFAIYGNAEEGFTHADAFKGFERAVFDNNTPAKWKANQDIISAKSSYMKEKNVMPDYTLRDNIESGKQTDAEKVIAEWGTKMMVFSDNISANPMWLTAYEKQIALGTSEKESVRFADAVIRRTLGSSRRSDVAQMLRSGKTKKLLTMFQTFFNTQYQSWAKESGIFLRDKDVVRLTAFVASKWFLFCFFNMLTSLKNPFDEEDRKDFYSDVATYPMTLSGPVGQVASSALKQVAGLQSFGYRMSPVESSISNTINLGGKINKVAGGKEDATSLIEPTAGVIGLYYGVPAQFNKLFFNSYDILFGNAEPEVGDIVRRIPKNRR